MWGERIVQLIVQKININFILEISEREKQEKSFQMEKSLYDGCT